MPSAICNSVFLTFASRRGYARLAGALAVLFLGCGEDAAVQGAGSDSAAIQGDVAGQEVSTTTSDSSGCTAASDCPAPGPCQLPVCTAGGQCSAVAKADGAPCSDGNACTTTDTCSQGQCAGGPPLGCDDLNPCTSDGCDGASGCVHLPATASTACDDGDPCTSGDLCTAGKCSPGLAICACTSHADCGKFDDGDLCNGTLYCDKSQGPPYTCKLNPASVVTCPGSGGDPCKKSVCQPTTGQCALQLAPPGSACDDGEACTAGDFCSQGLCQGGTATCTCKAEA